MKKIRIYISSIMVALFLVAGVAPVASASHAGNFNPNIIIDNKRAKRVPPPSPCKPHLHCALSIGSH